MLLAPCFLLRTLLGKKERSQFARKFRINQGSNLGLLLAGDDKRQKLEFHHVHLELGALGYIETFLFYWSWGFFPKKNPPRPIFVFKKHKGPPFGFEKIFFFKSPEIIFLSKPLDCIWSHDSEMV